MQFKWLKDEAGRRANQVESLDPSAAVTTKWIARGWIEPIKPPMKVPDPVVESKSIEAPPAHRSVMRGSTTRKS